jgi:sugar/nucleoside kinase (ribokinase family)
MAKMRKILVLAANPKDTKRLRLDKEIREIKNGLERAQKRDEFDFEQQLAARPQDVRRAMLDFRPNIVHFCGHGEGIEGITLEDEAGQAKLVSTEALAGLFELFAEKMECVVLNACYSEAQAEAISQHIDYVVGMSKSIGDNAAIEFAVAFYDALGAGESIEFAYNLARNAIQLAGLPEHLTPVLKSKEKPVLPTSHSNPKEPAILVIGSGVGEKVLQLDTEIRIGSKQTVKDRQELYGGSGVNYTLRLGCRKYNVLPILSIGPDWTGRNIQRKIEKLSSHKQVSQFVTSEEFLCDGLSTTESIVIVSGENRTILSGELAGFELFKEFVQKRMQQLDQLDQLDVRAVMIGHIHADGADVSPSREGEITKRIIDKYAEQDAVLFANFGRSQFRLGNKFWQRTLRKLTIFQLALNEVREFFSQDHTITSLRDIIKWFQDNQVTAIITMDKVGALATLGGGEHGIIFARPYDLGERLLDSTGAGDAFGAGVVSYFVDKITELEKNENRISKKDWAQITTIGNFEDAIERARHWAAYCCTTLGAASNCPDRNELERFKSTLGIQDSALVKRGSLNDFDDAMWFIDKAY